MRTLVVRHKNWFLWIIGFGVMITWIGFSVLMGWIRVDPREYFQIPERSFYGLTHPVLFAFGFCIIFVSLFIIFPALGSESLKFLKKLDVVFVLTSILGLDILLYGIANFHSESIPLLMDHHTWFDYSIIGIFLFIFGFTPMVFIVQDFKNHKILRFIFVGCTIIGFFFLGVSWIEYSYLFYQWGVPRGAWFFHFIIGCFLLFLGGLPLLVTYMTHHMGLLDGLRRIFLFLTLLGTLVYLSPTFAFNGIVIPLTILRHFSYFELLTAGYLLIVLGIVPLAVSYKNFPLIYRLRYCWIGFLALGVIQMLISAAFVNFAGFFIEIPLGIYSIRSPYGPTIQGMTWDVFFYNGALVMTIGLIFIASILFFEMVDDGRGEEMDPSPVS